LVQKWQRTLQEFAPVLVDPSQVRPWFGPEPPQVHEPFTQETELVHDWLSPLLPLGWALCSH
jgi:hypothetical protein